MRQPSTHRTLPWFGSSFRAPSQPVEIFWHSWDSNPVLFATSAWYVKPLYLKKNSLAEPGLEPGMPAPGAAPLGLSHPVMHQPSSRYRYCFKAFDPQTESFFGITGI